VSPAPKLFVEPGQQFGRLTVVDPEKRRPARGRGGTERAALCGCECGSEVLVSLYGLLRGDTRSCGCLYQEHASTLRARYPHGATHGYATHPLYHTHYNMMKRCYDPDHHAYANYGGRGVRVCKSWHDVGQFIEDIEREIGPRPAGRTLDRIDNDGNYEPGNVRWATWSEQRANQRRNRRTA
jgi:hypothetical protein